MTAQLDFRSSFSLICRRRHAQFAPFQLTQDAFTRVTFEPDQQDHAPMG
jgi:hypothetical protein